MEECSTAILDRRIAAKSYQYPFLKNFLHFEKARTSCSRTLHKIKRKQWKKFVDFFDHKTLTKDIWRLIKAFKKHNLSEPVISILNDDNQRALFENAKNKICPPSCVPDNTRNSEYMLSENRHHLEEIFTDWVVPTNEFNLALARKSCASCHIHESSYSREF